MTLKFCRLLPNDNIVTQAIMANLLKAVQVLFSTTTLRLNMLERVLFIE